MKFCFSIITGFAISCSVAPGICQTQNAAKPTEFTARLLAPISTRTSSAGDHFTAVVDAPPEFREAILAGKITKVVAPQRGIGKGKPSIGFEFETITINGATQQIGADLVGVSNSKGVKNVDEEGRAIGKTSNRKRVLSMIGGSALGALVGALAKGGSGAAEGAIIGAAAGLAIGLTLTSTGSDVEFFPGSIMTLKVSGIKR